MVTSNKTVTPANSSNVLFCGPGWDVSNMCLINPNDAASGEVKEIWTWQISRVMNRVTLKFV